MEKALRLYFRFSNVEEADRFYEEVWQGYAFVGTGNVSKKKNPKGESKTITVHMWNRSYHIPMLISLAVTFPSFYEFSKKELESIDD